MALRNSTNITDIPIRAPPVFQAFTAPGLLSPTSLTSFPDKILVNIIENGIAPLKKAIIENIRVTIF